MRHKNPFKYGSPVEGEYYFQMPSFTKLVRAYLDNHVSVVLYGPRRFGKTSFILNLMKEEEKERKVFIRINVFNITSLRDFLQQILRALKDKQNLSQKFKDWFNNLIKGRLIPSAEFDQATGQMSFSIHPDFTSDKDVKDLIQDTFTAFGKLGEDVIIAIDEFQQISQIEDGGWLEATIRTQMQELRNTSFLFSGSRKSVIYQMMNDEKGPFYKSCQTVDMPIFPDSFTDWIIERFETVDIKCDRKAISHLRKVVHDTPNYIQMVCFHLVASQNITNVDTEKIDDVLHTIVKQNAYAFETLVNSLTQIQHRALRLCANEPDSLYSKELIEKYEIPSGPTLATSIKSLKERGILEATSKKGQVVFDDPLFKIWLQKEFS